MNVTLHLNWQYDLDLIALKVHPDFEFGKWIKKAVIAWARKDEEFFIPLPDRPMPFSTELVSTTAHFRLSVDSEEDVINAINGIRYGFRGSLIKNIFRHYLPTPYNAPYYNTETYLVKVRGKKKDNKQIEDTPTTPPKKNVPDYLTIPTTTTPLPEIEVDDKTVSKVDVFESNENNAIRSENMVSVDKSPDNAAKHETFDDNSQYESSELSTQENQSGSSMLPKTQEPQFTASEPENTYDYEMSDEYENSDDDFDLFGAVDNMMNN